MPQPHRTLAVFAACAALTLVSAAASAGPETVRVAASDRYHAGRVYRFTFGGGYRDLWEAEIDLPVLDLATEGGGLVPVGRFGGLQTAVLAFEGADGRAYTFRGTDKDPSAVLDPVLRETVLRALIQDQMAAQHPGGPLVASVLSEAAGVLTIHERMVVLPDDPALGEYRAEFRGMVGNFYEYPTAATERREGFHGATEVLDQEDLYTSLSSGHERRVDAEAFLRARLLDLLLGDFDRHRKQWRWAKLPGDPLLQPIPEDRDQAFVRYDGVGQRVASVYVPILQNYGPSYPPIEGLTLHGWEQDRWLLAGLSWPDWEPVVRDLQARLDDATIDRAVAALPPEYAALDGDRLRTDLRGRRDRLPEAARAFYEHLSAEVDVRLSDAAELVRAEWRGDRRLVVQVWDAAEAGGADAVLPLFARSFDPLDTGEVRVYLRGGDDTVEIRGEPGPMILRVIAEGGDKRIDDHEAGRTRVYDALGTAAVSRGPGTVVDRRPYEPPPSDSGFVDVEGVPPRDWGGYARPRAIVDYETDVGVLLGVGVVVVDYGFRKHPWAMRHVLGGAFATGALEPVLGYRGELRPGGSAHLWRLALQYSGIEVLRYYGLGNESPTTEDGAFHRVRNQRFLFAPGFQWNFVNERLSLTVSPQVVHSHTREGDRLIDQDDPYGAGGFGSFRGQVRFVVDLRRSFWDGATLQLPIADNPAAAYPTRGLFVEVDADVSPPLWDVTETWGSVAGSVAAYGAVGGGRLAGSLRIGGEWTFGRVPYFGAAYLGGGGTFSGGGTARGYAVQRFAGDASVYGNLDLRLFVAPLTLVVPGEIGVHGFVDLGRVFVDGERSKAWHPSGGGGIWYAPLVRTNTLSLSVAASDEQVRFYLRAGFFY